MALPSSPASVRTERSPPPSTPASFRLQPRPECRYRRLLICAGISGTIHAVALFSSDLWPPPSVVRRPKTVVQELRFEMPLLDPEPPEEIAEVHEAEAESTIAPPMLPDVPHNVQLSDFAQPLQPPPPPGLKVGPTPTRVPLGRGGLGLRQGMSEVFDVNAVDQAPMVRTSVPPEYPAEMRRTGSAGNVLVEFVVDSDGKPHEVAVVNSSRTEFEPAALNAILKWRFRPGKKAGRAVNTRVRQLVNFSLQQD